MRGKLLALLLTLASLLFITVSCSGGVNPGVFHSQCKPGYHHNCGLSLADYRKPIYSSSVTGAWYAETTDPKGFSHMSVTVNFTTKGEQFLSKTPVMLGAMLCDSSTGYAEQFGYLMNTNTGDFGAVFAQGYLPGGQCSAGGLLYQFPVSDHEKSLTKPVYNLAYAGMFLAANDDLSEPVKGFKIAEFSNIWAQVGNHHPHGFNYWNDYKVNLYVPKMASFSPSRLEPVKAIRPARYEIMVS